MSYHFGHLVIWSFGAVALLQHEPLLGQEVVREHTIEVRYLLQQSELGGCGVVQVADEFATMCPVL